MVSSLASSSVLGWVIPILSTLDCLSLSFPRMGAILLLLRLGIVGKLVLKLKAAPPLLGEYTSISIVLPCPDNSMKASPSLIRGFLLYQEHWWPLGRWIASTVPQLPEIIRRTPCCTTWIWLCCYQQWSNYASDDDVVKVRFEHLGCCRTGMEEAARDYWCDCRC